MASTASDLFVERLMDWGVDTVFGLPGDGINGFMEALRTRHDRLRYIHVRHEEVGAMAAVGYARLTGKLGVCFATSGPGAIHLANGLLDARLEGVPLLAVTGMTYHDLIGTHYLQDYDTDYLFSNLAAYNQRIMSPEHIHNVLDLACRTALSRRAPVHIAFPIDYQSADAADLMRYKRNVPGHTTTAYRTPVRTPAETELEAAADLLRGKAKPAILAGQGARGARVELEQLAEALGADRQGVAGQGRRPRRQPVRDRWHRRAGDAADAGGDGGLRRAHHRRLLDALHRVPAVPRAGRVRADRRPARADRPALPRRRRPGG
jgi:pyruvate dehydrogenase (quinone)/pyruvate oxidase